MQGVQDVPGVRPLLERLLASLDGCHDGDEPVDELTHGLLCAGAALDLGARPAVVAAALLHDVGRSPLVAGTAPRRTHELSGAAALAPVLGEEVAWLVRHHVAAKAYLVATEPGYAARLSPASAASHERQRHRLGPAPVDHPWWPDAVLLRRLDDAAKDPRAPRPALGDVLDVLAPLLGPPVASGSGPDDTSGTPPPAQCSPACSNPVETGSGRVLTIRTRNGELRPGVAGRHLEV